MRLNHSRDPICYSREMACNLWSLQVRFFSASMKFAENLFEGFYMKLKHKVFLWNWKLEIFIIYSSVSVVILLQQNGKYFFCSFLPKQGNFSHFKVSKYQNFHSSAQTMVVPPGIIQDLLFKSDTVPIIDDYLVGFFIIFKVYFKYAWLEHNDVIWRRGKIAKKNNSSP